MNKVDPNLVGKCRLLRKKGLTLGEIMKATGMPKTTVWSYIKNFTLSPGAQNRLIRMREQASRRNTRRINRFNRKRREERIESFKHRSLFRKGNWSQKLVFLTAHFIFDGRVGYGSCEYYNRNDILIEEVRKRMEETLSLTTKVSLRGFGVKAIRYHNTTLAFYIKRKGKELRSYIKNAPFNHKKIFLRAFFDDEGSAGLYKNIRRVRGYQRDLTILRLMQRLLKDFGINSYINNKCGEVVISKKLNLLKFQKEINFSKGVYINPYRKNSFWERRIEKKEILKK